MAINLSPYKATDRASADIFNEKQMDIQTHLNNLQEQINTLTQQLNNKVELITTKSFNLQTDDIFKIPAGSYLFSGDSRTNANFPFQEQWCAGILIKYSGQTFGSNGENGTQTIIVMSHGKPIYYNVKAWDTWAGWKYSVPNS